MIPKNEFDYELITRCRFNNACTPEQYDKILNELNIRKAQ
jgi:hypothetical protein